MRIHCDYCHHLIKVNNELQYSCPKCHVKTTITPGKSYSSMSSSEMDNYWESFKNYIIGNRLDMEGLFLKVILGIGVALIIAITINFV